MERVNCFAGERGILTIGASKYTRDRRAKARRRSGDQPYFVLRMSTSSCTEAALLASIAFSSSVSLIW
ncbi:MAG: hypothetical protein JWO19_1819 [Bryobacterales bacterium]|nr:hypothetical protein [Bryobacterales bacterium]